MRTFNQVTGMQERTKLYATKHPKTSESDSNVTPEIRPLPIFFSSQHYPTGTLKPCDTRWWPLSLVKTHKRPTARLHAPRSYEAMRESSAAEAASDSPVAVRVPPGEAPRVPEVREPGRTRSCLPRGWS